MPRAVGNQGNWFAKVDAPRFPEIHGQSLPCVWDFWWRSGGTYSDEGFDPSNPQFTKLVEGLENGLAILRKRRKSNPNVWEADGYVAVYRIADVNVDNHLTFRFVERICNLDN